MKRKHIPAEQRVVLVPTGSTILLVPYAATRRALVIGPPASGQIVISGTTPVTGDAGVAIASLTSPLQLTYETHGEFVCGPLYARHSAADSNVGIMESFEPAD